MKKILVFLIVLLVLIQIAAAQMQVSHISPTIQKVKPAQMPIPCKEELDLWNDMEACKKQGLDYQVYIDQNRCKQVKCVKTEQAVTCPSDQELKRKAQECKAKNLDSEYYSDSNQCTQVQCREKQTACPTAHELEQRRLKCKAADKSYEYYADKNNCRQIRCLEKNCPTKEQLEERERTCKEKGLEPYSYTDSRGCRMVDCKETPQEVVHCKKTIEDNCIIIRCEDGYTFNSCTHTPERETVRKEEKMPEPVQPAKLMPADTVQTIRKCIQDMGDERAKIDDEVVWSRCRAAHPQLARQMNMIQSCITDMKRGYAEIDDEVVWSRCSQMYSEGKLSPQPDPPGSQPDAYNKPQQALPSEKIMIYKQPEQANKGGVLGSIGNFFKGIFK